MKRKPGTAGLPDVEGLARFGVTRRNARRDGNTHNVERATYNTGGWGSSRREEEEEEDGAVIGANLGGEGRSVSEGGCERDSSRYRRRQI